MAPGSADRGVFGAVRGTSTTGSVRGFTGEQTDAETGWLFLRARYYDPALGRFASVDTVQPNAPGTQGYHVYAYAANNPTTWTDPSGHFVGSLPTLVMTAMLAGAVVLNMYVLYEMARTGMLKACAKDPICALEVARTARILLVVLTNPLALALFRAIPAALLAFVWAITTRVIIAVLQCFQSGRCTLEEEVKDCVEWEKKAERGLYAHLQNRQPGWQPGPGRDFSGGQKRQIK